MAQTTTDIKKIDIYDFDKTIVPFDSGSLFCFYCFLHYPYLILFLPVFLPILAIVGLLMITNVIDFTSFKKFCFIFVPLIPLESAVKKFWDKYDKRVFGWFKERKRYSVVISASPDFLLGEIQKRLGFDCLICTRHNRKSGIIIGKNCRDGEKVNRLYEKFNKNEIEVVDVYSDSLSHDRPIFSLGKNCYHIVNGERIPFKYKEIYCTQE